MGEIKAHLPVKLVVPMLYSDEKRKNMAVQLMTKEWGETDYQSEAFEFEFSDYYNVEMGTPIFRLFVSFRKLIKAEDLVNVKLKTNDIEQNLANNQDRKVNLDPAYLSLGKFVLATTKNQQHRLLIKDGIFEEITLFFRSRNWQSYPWTYPDYCSERYKKILFQIRTLYKKQLNTL